MLLSQTARSALRDLSIEDKTSIVFGGFEESNAYADFAILLGGHPDVLLERSQAAAKLYHEGRVKYIVPTGGVEWDYTDEKTTEALRMTSLLKGLGIPEDAIIIENEARTTVENMIFSLLQISRKIDFYKAKDGVKVIIVTSPRHIRRSLLLAKMLLPEFFEISGVTAETNIATKENWHNDERSRKYIATEISLMKHLVDSGMTEDIEF